MASLELKKEIQEALKNTTLSRTLGNFWHKREDQGSQGLCS